MVLVAEREKPYPIRAVPAKSSCSSNNRAGALRSAKQAQTKSKREKTIFSLFCFQSSSAFRHEHSFVVVAVAAITTKHTTTNLYERKKQEDIIYEAPTSTTTPPQLHKLHALRLRLLTTPTRYNYNNKTITVLRKDKR